MSFLGLLGKGLDILTDVIPGANAVQGVIEAVIPKAASFFDGSIDTAMPSYDIGPTPVANVTSGGSQMSLPILSLEGGSVPGAIATTNAIEATSPGGLPVPWWKGPGGKLQLPWNDPKVAEYLKPYSLDDAYLKPYYRAPKGYVVLKDASGKPFAVQKEVAKFFGLWKPAAKPPISATEWKHYKNAHKVDRVLKRVAKDQIASARKSARSSAIKSKKRR